MRSGLSTLPNIGKVLEDKLIKVGITGVDELRAVGSVEAFRKIREQLDPGACNSMLFALEGAVQGIRWHGLPKELRDKLVEKIK